MISNDPTPVTADTDELENHALDNNDADFNMVVILDKRLELDTLLCALDHYQRITPDGDHVECARRMRSAIAGDAGYV